MQKHKTVLNIGEVMSMFQTLKLLNILCSNVALQLNSRSWRELIFDLLSVQANSSAQDTQIKLYKFSHKQHTVQETEA